jgi:hypothetical protein
LPHEFDLLWLRLGALVVPQKNIYYFEKFMNHSEAFLQNSEVFHGNHADLTGS